MNVCVCRTDRPVVAVAAVQLNEPAHGVTVKNAHGHLDVFFDNEARYVFRPVDCNCRDVCVCVCSNIMLFCNVLGPRISAEVHTRVLPELQSSILESLTRSIPAQVRFDHCVPQRRPRLTRLCLISSSCNRTNNHTSWNNCCRSRLPKACRQW